jgi:hypothetical protein
MKKIFCIITLITVLSCNSNNHESTSQSENHSNDTMSIPDSLLPALDTVSSSDEKPVPTNRLIVPGQSIGLTSLNEDQDSIKLGPAASNDAGMGKNLATWYTIHGKDTTSELEIFFSRNMGGEHEASRVVHIRITSPIFETMGHIRNGSPWADIQKSFPASKKIASYKSPKTDQVVTIYDDSKSGIAFEIDSNNTCVGITIHKPGDRAYETYNSLYDVKFD